MQAEIDRASPMTQITSNPRFILESEQNVIKFSKQLKRQPIQASTTSTLLID